MRLIARPLEDGRQEVLGVMANDGKADVAIKARKAVIIGTGSFDWDREMCKQYLPFTTPYTFQIDTCTGDGFKMAQAVGADCGMVTQGWGCPVEIYAYDEIESGSVTLPINASSGDFYDTYFQGRRIGFGIPYFVVSRMGQRFYAEPGTYSSMDAWAGLDAQGDFKHRYLPYSFAIFDAAGAAESQFDTLDPLPGWLTRGGRPLPSWPRIPALTSGTCRSRSIVGTAMRRTAASTRSMVARRFNRLATAPTMP